MAAGLVPRGHFPGLPGMRKGRVTIFTNGSLPEGRHTVVHQRAREPGARRVERAPGNRFVVRVNADYDEAEQGSRPHRRGRVRGACAGHAETGEADGWVHGRVEAAAASDRGAQVLASMGRRHRRKLPAGWRAIEGRRSV